LQNVEKPSEAFKHREASKNTGKYCAKVRAHERTQYFGCATWAFEAHVGGLFAHISILAGGGGQGQADRTCRLSYCTVHGRSGAGHQRRHGKQRARETAHAG
jgi:hypothetical protein